MITNPLHSSSKDRIEQGNNSYFITLSSFDFPKNKEILETGEGCSNPLGKKCTCISGNATVNIKGQYHRYKEVEKVTGFVVNIHDAINLDIDLVLYPHEHFRYQNVVSNQYIYVDYDDSIFIDPEIIKKETDIEIGTAYRCRLKGIGIVLSNQNEKHILKSNRATREVTKLIYRTGGWVECTLSDVDIYQRLLVDIYVRIGNQKINVRDYLLDLFSNGDSPLFYLYPYKDKSLEAPDEKPRSHKKGNIFFSK